MECSPWSCHGRRFGHHPRVYHGTSRGNKYNYRFGTTEKIKQTAPSPTQHRRAMQRRPRHEKYDSARTVINRLNMYSRPTSLACVRAPASVQPLAAVVRAAREPGGTEKQAASRHGERWDAQRQPHRPHLLDDLSPTTRRSRFRLDHHGVSGASLDVRKVWTMEIRWTARVVDAVIIIIIIIINIIIIIIIIYVIAWRNPDVTSRVEFLSRTASPLPACFALFLEFPPTRCGSVNSKQPYGR